jgi:hypothetical protein
MSLSDLLPKGKGTKVKVTEVSAKDEMIFKNIKLPEWVVNEIALMAHLDETRGKRKRNFKTYAEDILTEIARKSIDNK